jgi:hypothetical protein
MSVDRIDGAGTGGVLTQGFWSRATRKNTQKTNKHSGDNRGADRIECRGSSDGKWRSGDAFAFLGLGPATAEDGLSGDGWEKDATAGADRTKLLPDGQRDPLATRTGGGNIVREGVMGKEVERAEEGGGRIQKRDEIRPGDVLVGRWKVRGTKEDLVAKNSGAIVGGVNRITMPLVPPMGTSVA